MYIKALSKRNFINSLKEKGVNDDTVENYTTTYFISINEPAEPDEHFFKRDHPNVLTLYFHDAEDDGSYIEYLHGYDEDLQKPVYKPMVFFTDEMAKTVVDFLETAKVNDVKSLLIHCTAGISRSGAVSYFARNFFDSPNCDIFKSENPQILPNNTVLTRLNKEYEQRKR